MSQGPHEHEWVYNQVHKRVCVSEGKYTYAVIRFCPLCKLVEEIELITKEE